MSRNLTIALGLLAVGGAALWASLTPRPGVVLAYVADAGNNCVQVIDLESGATLRRLYTGATPWRLAVAPGGKTLWVQHWASATTAVVDLTDHEVVRVLPFRGPGAFDAAGDSFLTFSWPGSALHTVDARSFQTTAEHVTEIPQVYDLAVDPDGQRLHLVQFDPMVQGPRPRYSYALTYPYRIAEPNPLSRPTGRSPAAIRTLRTGPFLLTADRETNGLSLLNDNGDGRAIPACEAPQAILLSADETRMAVLCWPGEGARRSRAVLYRTDFTARPWPTVAQTAAADFDGGLVAGAFAPGGDSLYLVDRAGNRLLEVDAATLAVRRSIPTGDVPVDVALVAVTPAARDRAAAEGRARRTVREMLTRMRAGNRPFTDLSWTEVTDDGRRQRAAFRPPDRLRVESADGGLRLSAGGHSVSVAPDGRFWVTPRQEILSLLWGLAAVPVDDAVRLLAGDVPGSPFLRGGLAVDAVSEVEEAGDRSLVIGALRKDERVSQLWIDTETARPSRLIEAFPVFETGGHNAPGFSGVLETRFHEPREIAPGLRMPTLLERVADGRTVQRVRLEELKVDSGLAPELFDAARLGGARPGPDLFHPEPRPEPDIQAPPYLQQPGEAHPAYTSNPPTSGPRLPFLADWGPHALPVPLELQAHNLEHGGVLLQYNCPQGCPETAAKLEALAKSHDLVIAAPYPFMPPGFALTAWGHLETLDRYDEAAIRRFIDTWAGIDHHAGAASR
jgi:hypothetical protein